MLLDSIAEIFFQRVVGDNNGLTEQRTALGAAQVKHITQRRVVLQGQVVGLAHQAVGHTRTVHKQIQPQLVAGGGNVGQFLLIIKGADLGGVRDVDHAGLDLVLVAGVGAVLLHGFADLAGRDLAVFVRQGQALVAGGFHRAGLMYMDVAGVGTQCALPWLQRGVDDRQVGLGRAHKEMHGSVRGIAQGADLIGCGGTIAVLAVAGGLVKVGFLHQVQHRRGGTFTVVTFKAKHKSTPFFANSVIFIITPVRSACNPSKLQV